MATVPEPQGQRIAPTGPDAPTIRVNANPLAFGAGIAESGQRLAANVDEYQNVLTQHMVALQQIQNSADADDRSTQFATAANDIATDFTVNQRGGNALPQLDDYKGKISDARTKGGEDLNPIARKMYEANTRRLESSFLGSMSRHAAEQNRDYTVQTATSQMDVARNLAVAHANDPQFLQDALDTIHDKGTFLSHYLGLGDEVGADKINEQTSKLYSEVIVQKANDNPVEASKFFEDHKEEMRGEDISKIDSFLKGRTEPYVARQGADEIANGDYGTGVVNEIRSNAKAFFSRLAGGDVLVTSEVRTEADQERLRAAGYKPAKNSEHKPENGYAVDLVPTGNMTMKQLYDKVKAADLGAHQILNEGNHVHVGFKKDSPAFAARGPSINQAQTLPQLEGLYANGIAAVDARVDKLYGGDPHIKSMMESEFASIYNLKKAVLTATAGEAYNNVAVAAMDPAAKPTSLEELQRQPGFASSWQYLTPSQQRGVLNVLHKNANPTPNDFTADQLSAFSVLDGEAKAKPDKFMQRDPLTDPLYKSLPVTYQMSFMKMRNTIAANKPISEATNRAVSQVYNMLPAELKGPDNADDYSKFVSKLSDQVKLYYDDHKKAPDQTTVRGWTRDLLMDQANWGGKTHTLPDKAYTQENFVPAWAEAQIRAADPTLTPEQVAAVYQRRLARVR